MELTKRYEILDALPTYGPMYIPVAGNGRPFYSEGFAIRFFKTDKTEWVANFEPGWTDLKRVVEFDDLSKVLVIAGGTCYLMNPDDMKPICVFGVGYSGIFKTNKGRFILQDQTCVTIVEPDGEHWDTERISWDGLKDLEVEDNLIKGLSYDPMEDADEWVPFSYDYNRKILTGGSYNRYKTPRKL